MGTTLTGTTPQDTYDSLIKVTDNGPLSGTAKYLSDGLGNDSALALSTTAVGIGTTAPVGLLDLYKAAAAARLAIRGDAGQNRLISYRTGALQRFGLYVNNTAESGANAGSDFAIRAYNDAGTLLSTPLFIQRSTGKVGIGTSAPSTTLHVSDAAATTATFNSTFGQLAISFANSGTTFAQIGSGVSVASTGGAADLGFGTAGQANASIIFATGAGFTERFRITNNGVTFNGDTAAANALDDYEEGTWTPTDNSGGGLTLTTAVGSYTKIGREVFYRAFVQYPSTVDVSNATLGGLPFTVANLNSARSGNVTYTDEATLVYAFNTNNTSLVGLYTNVGGFVSNAAMSGNIAFIVGNYYV